jgi:hypothetical protein
MHGLAASQDHVVGSYPERTGLSLLETYVSLLTYVGG